MQLLAVVPLLVLGVAAQDIDFDLAYAAPNPTYSVASGVTQQLVTYTPSAIYASALPEITQVESYADYSSFAVSVPASASTAAAQVKRDASACALQPIGAGPIVIPDNAVAFTLDPLFGVAASLASVPSGYSQTFSNLQASSSAYGYLGYTTLLWYDTWGCAAQCNAISGCQAINIYYERDPLLAPGPSCPNPSSTTTIKCAFWGSPVNLGNANNAGQYRDEFQVVIAGSNGYVKQSIVSPWGYSTPNYLGNAAINAPLDALGANTYLGSAIFNSGPFNASLCAEACSQKSAYAIAHPPADGSPPQTCQFFNTYILYINSTADLQGQYCAMYSESWPASYATNVGQYRGSDHFLIENSYSYSNATNPGFPSVAIAVEQASQAISYSSLQPFCSTLLGYTAKASTVTTAATAAAYTTPAGLTQYPAVVVTSACKLAATSATATTTAVTTSAATTTAATTVVPTSTATLTTLTTSTTSTASTASTTSKTSTASTTSTTSRGWW